MQIGATKLRIPPQSSQREIRHEAKPPTLGATMCALTFGVVNDSWQAIGALALTDRKVRARALVFTDIQTMTQPPSRPPAGPSAYIVLAGAVPDFDIIFTIL